MAKMLLVLCFLSLAASGFAQASIKKQDIGVYDLKKGDISLKLTNYGAKMMSLVFPDKNGKLGDILLDYRTLEGYINSTSHHGATVGRVANRIRNAHFTLNGIRYNLTANSGNNSIHGGKIGFSHVIWKVKEYQKEAPNPSITFTYHSFDGEEGFPGDLLATVSYTLYGKNQLSIIMKAKALNKATPVNLVNHAFWNLGGHNSGTILNEQVQIFASKITVVDSQLIPTGEFASVKGTPFDFLKPHIVGSRINQLPETKGYDHNFVIDGGNGKKINPAAIVFDKTSGRVMEISTNAPGVQFYSGNKINNVKGKDGAVYQAYAGLCLETQAFPDAVNHPNFPSTIVNPGEEYKHYMFFKFSTKAPHGFS
ncbi:hypothetical protein L6164_008414 [Bauhinia variegata]|uniref:Uncharacterized protein n=1 Tax=Bauhinia variegata TaxID=167791 RepID=A0ACB9PM66_BAUVA|nr:hypothetical protein L6164_008414 [Bauhinia variegata]